MQGSPSGQPDFGEFEGFMEDEEEEEELGTDLVLRELATGAETTVEHVSAYAFAENAALLAAAVAAPEDA